MKYTIYNKVSGWVRNACLALEQKFNTLRIYWLFKCRFYLD